MPRIKSLQGQTCPEAFQLALDALDVTGHWEWDPITDRVTSDTFMALLFSVDPIQAKDGAPLTAFMDGIHPDDREQVLALIRRSAVEGSAYLTEHRVISADGQTRCVLVRGRFTRDRLGRPEGGSGILIDITRMRMSEGTFGGVDPTLGDTPLERAADHAIAAQHAIMELQDAVLKAHVDALLMALGRKLARHEVQDRRQRMN